MGPSLLQVFDIGICLHFHRCTPHIGNPSRNDNHVILIGSFQKPKVVHGRRGNVPVGVAFCRQGGYLVNPLHQNASKKTSNCIQMVGTDDMHGFDDRF